MSELQIQLTEEFPDQAAEQLKQGLGKYLPAGELRRYMRLSGGLEPIIRLLGDLVVWAPITAAATAYFTRLAFRAADETWDKITGGSNSKEVERLAAAVDELAKAVERVGGRATVAFGLPIPDDHFGTTISMEYGDREELARALALFVIHAGKIEKAMLAEVDAGRVPAAGAQIVFETDERASIRWQWWDENDRPHIQEIHVDW